MNICQIIIEAENAQNMIVKRVQNKYKVLKKFQQGSQQNQFITPQFFQSLKQCQKTKQAKQQYEDKNNTNFEQIQKKQQFCFQFNQRQIYIVLNQQDLSENDFRKLIQQIEKQQGKKINEIGMQKIINSIKSNVEQLQRDNNYISANNQQNNKLKEITFHTTMNTSMIAKSKVNQSQGNKQNFKIGQINYQTRNAKKSKHNQPSNPKPKRNQLTMKKK